MSNPFNARNFLFQSDIFMQYNLVRVMRMNIMCNSVNWGKSFFGIGSKEVVIYH